MSPEARLHVVVRGRVQGVGFRWFVRERARALDLAGWVKNREDGGVEVAAAGNSAAVSQLRAALERGPDGAVISGIEELPQSVDGTARPFSILR